MISFAIDFGNGFVKAMSDKRSIVAPADIAPRYMVEGGSLGDISDELNINKDLDVHVYQSDLDEGQDYIWGEDLEGVTKDALPTHTNRKRYSSSRFKVLCQFVLAELAMDFTEEELKDVMLVTGMPSQEIGTPEETSFKKNLERPHLVFRDNQAIHVKINKVKIVEQPIGSLLDLYMTDDGQMYRSLQNDTITVIDFGSGTTIFDTFKGLREIEESSRTMYEGMNNVFQAIENDLKNQYKITADITTDIKNAFYADDLVIKNGNKTIPFEEIAEDRINKFIGNFLADFEKRMKNIDTIDKFVITGGGLNIVKGNFNLIAQHLVEELNVQYADDPQKSNIRGFYKLSKVLS